MWRVDQRRLEEWIEQLTEKTAAWTRAHPLRVRKTDPEKGTKDDEREDPRPLSEEDELMTTVQAAEVAGVTRQNVNHVIRIGRLRAMKAGSNWLVSAEDVRDYRALGSRGSQVNRDLHQWRQ